MANICIIPARGGSKRIPRKNIRLFHGKPIIAYAIECAQKSRLFDRIIVSTEDPEIAEISQELGAEVPFLRSPETADDFSTTSDVLLEVLTKLDSKAQLPNWACCLYPTTPLLLDSDLNQAYQLFNQFEYDVVLAAVAFDFPIQRAFELNAQNQIQLREPDLISKRSQDLAPTFHDAGAFYFFKTETFLKQKTLWSGNLAAFKLPVQRVQDIDNLADWEAAEFKFQQLQNHD
jgi:pseudaminic acid cytidylyltransferase